MWTMNGFPKKKVQKVTNCTKGYVKKSSDFSCIPISANYEIIEASMMKNGLDAGSPADRTRNVDFGSAHYRLH